MKFSIKQFKFLLLVTFVTSLNILNIKSTNQLEKIKANSSQESTKGKNNQPTNVEELQQLAQEQFEQEFREQSLRQILLFLNRLEGIWQGLAQALHNGRIKPKNPQYSLQNIQAFVAIIHEFNAQASKISSIDGQRLKMLFDITNLLIKCSAQAIKTGLNKFTEPNFEALFKRSAQNQEFSSKDLQKNLLLTNKNIEQLDKDAQKVGLWFYQRAFRKLEKLDAQYNLRGKFIKGLVGGFALSFLVSKFDQETLNNIPLIGRWRKIVGPSPDYKVGVSGQMELANKGELSKFGHTLNFFGNKLGILKLNLDQIIGVGAAFTFFTPDVLNLWKKAHEKTIRICDYLRGGPLSKRHGGVREPRISFDDIIGQEHIKNKLQVAINYIVDPEKYELRGNTPRLKFMFEGDTRTGKTWVAEAFVGELNKTLRMQGKHPVAFMDFNAAEVSEYGIDNIIAAAKYQAPCVLFIDEFDMLGLQRDRNLKELSKVLTTFSGFMEEDLKKIILITATNMPKSFDKSLLARFGDLNILHFDYPTLEERKTSLKKEFTEHAIMVEEDFITKLAKYSAGCSFEMLHDIIVYASRKAENEQRALTQQDLEKAFDEVIWRIVQKKSLLPENQKEVLAAHLAGHTIASVLLPTYERLAQVTIKEVLKKIQEEPLYLKYENQNIKESPTEHGKLLTYNKYNHLDSPSREELLAECKVCLAGHIAELLLLGSASGTYHHHDKPQALAIARFIQLGGLDKDSLPKEIYNEKLKKAYETLEQCEHEVHELLSSHIDDLKAIQHALLEKETLTVEEVSNILQLEKRNSDIISEEDLEKNPAGAEAAPAAS